MSKTLAYGLLAIFTAASVAVIAARPEWLSDNNTFLKAFVGADLLNLLGVILAITLASVANIHLEFNKIEERYRARGLVRSRDNLKKSTVWLISLFLCALVLVAVKPLACGGETAEAIVNAGSILIVLWHVLILVDLMQLVFAISPDVPPTKPPSP